MYLYCFCLLSSNESNLTNISVVSTSSDVFYCHLVMYSSHLFHSMMISSPIQELEPGATPCRGGRCAAAILTDRSSRKTKKYLDYDYARSRRRSRTFAKAVPGAGWDRAIVCTLQWSLLIRSRYSCCKPYPAPR